ncbi:MAG: argininosuccinate lyase, partial [Leptospiraceae bacterium]|nr:argininosuccinate lyase [Leptospiraceae bacterium]
LSDKELMDVLNGLEKIRGELERGELTFRTDLEDIHMHIESRLTELIGDAGKKLHTGRSRNDQVAIDMRLFIRQETLEIQDRLKNLILSFKNKAERNVDFVMPGYTHLQVAQPVRVSHYLFSYFWLFLRDYKTLQFCLEENDSLVLGSGALAGVNYPSDREFMREELGFKKVSENSIDSVSSRDHMMNFLFSLAKIMTNASRFCEEILLFSSQEFSFLRLPDSLTTGSSIMPQKKNPDIAELIRGKSARVISNLHSLMVLVKGLPLAYDRDLQEDKLFLFDSAEQVKLSIEGMKAMLDEMEFRYENMRASLENGFATATDLADFLVNEKGIPFREAHELVGRLVSVCVSNNKTLFTIEEKERKPISEFFMGEEYFQAISLEGSTDKKKSSGSTSRQSQLEQIKKADEALRELGID